MKELQAELAAGVIALEISNRNARVKALQVRWDLMRQVIQERAAHYPKGGDDDHDALVPGGTTGLISKTTRARTRTLSTR